MPNAACNAETFGPVRDCLGNVLFRFDVGVAVGDTLRVLDESGLRPHFQVVTISGDIGIKKPDPGVFRPALATLDLSPERVVYVGDAPEDAQAARAAGMTSIRIQRYGDTESDKAADFRPAGPRDWSEASSHVQVARLGELPSLLL